VDVVQKSIGRLRPSRLALLALWLCVTLRRWHLRRVRTNGESTQELCQAKQALQDSKGRNGADY
jgi:hypothetical protein